MANIVTIGSSRYLVDVGYGVDGPSCPLPLESGEICIGLPGQQLKLEKKKLAQHTDPDQTVWVYSQRREPEEFSAVFDVKTLVQPYTLNADALMIAIRVNTRVIAII